MRLSEREVLLLQDCPLFSGMNREKIAEALILLQAELQETQRGDMLVRYGDPMRRFGLVLHGHVEVFTEDFEGRHMIMASVSRGTLFGEALAFIRTKEAPLYIRATEFSKILWMSPERLLEGGDPSAYEMTRRYANLLSLKLLSVNDRVQVLSKHTIRDKLMTYLTQCRVKAGSAAFALPFGREALADYLGVNRSALCREISAMIRDGLIRVDGRRVTLLKEPEEL